MDNDITGQHQPDLVFHLQRLMGQAWIARPKNCVRPEIDVDLRLECLLDIDPADDTKPFGFKGSFGARNGIIERNLKLAAK